MSHRGGGGSSSSPGHRLAYLCSLVAGIMQIGWIVVQSPVNTTAVEDLPLRLGRLAEELPEVAELDLNPVLVSADGAVVVDAKMRLEGVGLEPDAVLRQLRTPP